MVTSTDLVPVFPGQISGQAVQLGNARGLHRFLGAARDFPTWIKKRLNDGGFARNQDYIEVFHKTVENPAGGRPTTDYHLTLESPSTLA